MPIFVSQKGCGETKGKQAFIFDKPSGSEERVPFCCPLLFYFLPFLSGTSSHVINHCGHFNPNLRSGGLS